MTSTRTIGPYRLTALRTESAAGNEYAATDTDLGVKVLLTLVESLAAIDGQDGAPDPELQRAYQRAMNRLMALDHPLLGMPRRVSPPTSEIYWYTSQATDGTPLRRHLDHRGPWDWRTVGLLLLEATAALGAAHQRGCAHGNIQSETVLVEPNGAVRFLRPDVAGRVLFEHSDSSTISLAALWDEPIYLSPDVLNRRVPGPADDIYALGVLVYELLTGRLPYASPSEPLGRFQSRRSAPDPRDLVPELPESISLLVRSMLAPRAAIRIPHAAALRAEIQQQLLADVGPNEVRANLVDALRARVQVKAQGAQGKTNATERAPVDREGAERAVEQALLSAGMTPGSAERANSKSRRGLWFALGLVGAVGLTVTLMPGDDASPDKRAAAPSVQVASSGAPAGKAQGAEVPPPPQPEPLVVDPAEVARLKAEALIGSGQVALAQRVLNRALTTEADDTGALRMLLASTLASEGKIKEAVAAYVAADGQDGVKSAGHLKAGVLVATDGRCADAIPFFLEVQSRAGDSSEILKLLGNCQLIGGDNLVAAPRAHGNLHMKITVGRKIGQKMLRIHDLDIVIPLAQSLEKTGALMEARKTYRRALSLSPDNLRAREGLARLKGGNPERMVALDTNSGVASEPDEPLTLSGMEASAHAAFQRGDYRRAAAIYGDAVKQAREEATPSLLRNYAVALHKATKLRSAVRAYEAAIAVLPKDAELHYLMGMALSAQRQDSSALRALRVALEIQPTNTKARFELGLVALRRGRHGEAADAFEETLRREPGNKAALQNLIKARVDGGNQDGALEALGRMHARYPSDAQTLLTMAALLQTMDRDDEAEALLTEACATGIKQACP
ncbi:MAG: tetratricopeptide repeat protein [Myxococcota bacterium]